MYNVNVGSQSVSPMLTVLESTVALGVRPVRRPVRADPAPDVAPGPAGQGRQPRTMMRRACANRRAIRAAVTASILAPAVATPPLLIKTLDLSN